MITPNRTMVYVYRLPDNLAEGYCFFGGRPIMFTNIDWFNGFDGMTKEDLELKVRQKKYCKVGDKILVLSPENNITFTMNI